MEVRSAKAMGYVLSIGLLLGFGIFLWNDAFAEAVPAPQPVKMDKPVVVQPVTPPVANIPDKHNIGRPGNDRPGNGNHGNGNNGNGRPGNDRPGNDRPGNGNHGNGNNGNGRPGNDRPGNGHHGDGNSGNNTPGINRGNHFGQNKFSDGRKKMNGINVTRTHTTSRVNISNNNSGNHNFGRDRQGINPASASARSQGLGSLVAQGRGRHGVVQGYACKVPLSTGKAATVDLHGDDLIHLGKETPADKKDLTPIVTTNISDVDRAPVQMAVHEVKQVLDKMICMADTVEAAVITVGKKGEVVLHPEVNANNSTVTTQPINAPVVAEEAPTVTETQTIATPPTIEEAPVVTSPISQTPTIIETPTVTKTPAVTETANNPVIEPTIVSTPPLETVTNPVSPHNSITPNTILIARPQTAALNDKVVDSEAFISTKTISPGLDRNDKTLIVVGQVVQKSGNVIEMDRYGNGHPLAVGDNVHMGGRFIFKGGEGSLKIKSFTGEIITVA